MKKILFALTALAASLAAGTATADSIDGNFGVSGYLGFVVPSDGADNVDGLKLETNTAFTGGGGIIYGIGRNAAAEVQISHSTIDIGNFDETKFEVTNVNVGFQYRFTPERKLVPYIGAGMAILLPELVENGTTYDVDTAYAAYMKVGVDYFVAPRVAVSAEAKQVLGGTADITEAGIKEGKFNPNGFYGLFGVKYFF